MDDSTPRRNRLRGWWGVAVLIGVLLVTAVGLGLLWYHSNGDLLAVREEAKALAIPTTWPEVGLTRSPSEVIARYERLAQLAKSLPDYDSLAITGKIISGSGQAPRLKPYLAIPQEARDHHAGLDQATVAEFLLLLDQLPDDILVQQEHRTLTGPNPEIGWFRNIVRYQQERVLLAAPEEVVRETERLLRFVEIRDCHLLIELLVQVSLVEISLSPIAGRLHDLQKRMATLADRLDRLSQRLEVHLTNAFIGEFVLANHTCENPAATRQAMGLFAPDSLWDDLMWGPQMRAGRGPLLSREMAWIQMTRLHPTPADLVSNARRISRESQDLRRWIPTETLSLQLMGVVPTVLNMTAKCQLRLQLMAAEVHGTTWPIDAFDPSGKPLRRFERDGVLMGAYTVYEDGFDNGGDKKKDRYFPLYGPLELPVSTTP